MRSFPQLTKLICFLLAFNFSLGAVAQDDSATADLTNDPVVKQTVSDVGLVVGAGAGGALIGLSTLSFYEKPKEHWKNITIGGAIGVILGVAAVVYIQATRTSTIEDEAEEEEEARLNDVKHFSTVARTQWHQESRPSFDQPTVQYSFTF